MRISGVTIKLSKRTQTGADDFNQPTYSTEWVDVDNVLYAPASSADIVTSTDLSGYSTVYQLAIPKGDTNSWSGEKVCFLDKEWEVIGEPLEGIDSLIPLDWNRKVTVGRYE